MNAVERVARSDPGAAFMLALRRDHAGLSRVLREMDTQAHRLTLEPEQARPVLVDALGYLLHYQHAHHHPREDRLFARIQARDRSLYATMQQLSEEHQTGELETARLREDLAAATEPELKGSTGSQLAERVTNYIRHSRLHMRHEEAVFYARAEQSLDTDDWETVIAGEVPEDPINDLERLSDDYPHLAAQLGLTTRHLGLSETVGPVNAQLRAQMLALADLYGGLFQDAVELTRLNIGRVMAIRGPTSLAQAAGAITTDNLRFAGQCLVRPSRWAINAGAGLLVSALSSDSQQRDQRQSNGLNRE